MEEDRSVKALIANLMVDNLLYLKFLLDPFVYAWRMGKYREAFFESFRRSSTGRKSRDISYTGRETQETGFSSAPGNGSVVTLLSFKSLEWLFAWVADSFFFRHVHTTPENVGNGVFTLKGMNFFFH